MAPFINIDVRLVPAKQYATPTTGSTVTVNNTGYINLMLNPAGTLATLTVTLPGSPTDGDKVTVASSQIVTGLTMNGGTIIGALTTMAVGAFASYVYVSDATSWFRNG